MLARGEKNGFNVGIDAAIHAGHLELVLEVRHGTQAAHDDLGATFTHKTHEQTVEADNFQVGQITDHFPRHLDPLTQAEKRLLGRAFGNGQDQVIGTGWRRVVPGSCAPG